MLTVTAAGTAKIKIKGLTTELASVAARVEFWANPSGKELQASLHFYESVAAFEAGSAAIAVVGEIDGTIDAEFNIMGKNYSLALGTDPETYQEQTITVAHNKAKADLEALGYTVAIVGI